jgi:hypothetical protein
MKVGESYIFIKYLYYRHQNLIWKWPALSSFLISGVWSFLKQEYHSSGLTRSCILLWLFYPFPAVLIETRCFLSHLFHNVIQGKNMHALYMISLMNLPPTPLTSNVATYTTQLSLWYYSQFVSKKFRDVSDEPSLIFKNLKIKIYRIIILSVVWVKLGHSHWGRKIGWGCLRIFGPKEGRGNRGVEKTT